LVTEIESGVLVPTLRRQHALRDADCTSSTYVSFRARTRDRFDLSSAAEKPIELSGAFVQRTHLYFVERTDVLLSFPGHRHVGTILPAQHRTQGSLMKA
jgi:hypothetical protein